MPSLQLPYPLDLTSTLLGGQTFCWTQKGDGIFSGWIGKETVTLQLHQNHLSWDRPSITPDLIRNYFCLDLNLSELLGPMTQDAWLRQASHSHPGLRPVREDSWECLVNFLCSSLKQIVQIQQINSRLRSHFGGVTRAFPSAQTLAEAGENALRSCALGYRARHVWQTAQLVAETPDLLQIPVSRSTSWAAQHLEQLPGVGPKISRCVILYAYSRWDAFPVDVWVDRLIRELYFPRRRKPFHPRELEFWSRKQFGPTRGLAQLRLFHWFRTRPRAQGTKAKGK